MDDYRVPMTRATFDAIPNDREYSLGWLWDRIIDANPRIMVGDFGDATFLAKVTPAQRLFLLLGVFDGQVANGGISQFFWNCLPTIFAVRDALEELGETELLDFYERALQSLASKVDNWDNLRAQWSELAPGDVAWEPFRQSYNLLNLSWFDKAYFHEWGFNEAGDWVVIREGLSGPFARRLVEFVRSRPEQFITGQNE